MGGGGQYPITWYGTSRLKELHDKWPVNGKHEYAAAGNMKSIPRRLVVEWVLKSWSKVSNKSIANSMKSLGLTLAIDGSNDRLISCFNKEKKCESGKSMLENQNFNDSTLQDDPFVILDQVIVEAAPIFNIVNEDDDQINIE